MAGDGGTASEPKSAQSSQDPEKTQAQTETEHGQTDREEQRESEEQPAPELPPRPLPNPLPLPPKDTPRGQPLPPPLPGVSFGPLPAQNLHEPVNFERPHFPAWHKTKLVLGTLSLVVSAIILAIGIALGFHNAPYYIPGSFVPIDLEFGTSGAAAGLAILVTTVELLKICLSSQGRGMHPGALVAFHLLIWLTAFVAVVTTAILLDGDFYYGYPRANKAELSLQNAIYAQVLLGFDCVLLAIHFVVFVGACVETNKVEKARKVVLVRVPVPAGASFPRAGYPIQGGDGTGPIPRQVVALYGGYYAPAPAEMVSSASRQQGGMGLLHGYYAPAGVPARTPSNSARNDPRQ